MRTKAARLPRLEPADPPARPSPPKQPADGANWHDWLTLGVFVLSTCLLLMGIAAALTLLSRLDSQENQINTLKTSLEQLGNQKSPSLAETLNKQHTQSMNEFKKLREEQKPTADPRLDKLADLQLELQEVSKQLASIRAALTNWTPPDAQPTGPPPAASNPGPATDPAQPEVFSPAPEPGLPQP